MAVDFQSKSFLEDLIRFDRAPPFEIVSRDLGRFLVALVNGSVNKCKKNDDALHDQRTVREFFSDEKKIKTLRSTLSMVGTHNLKCPNANVSTCVVVDPALQHAADPQPYVHSASIECQRLISGSGNAGYAGYFRLLGQEFVLNGTPTSIIQSLAKGEGLVCQQLIELGLCETDLQNLHETASSHWCEPSGVTAPDRFLKQVIWPGGEGEDIVITPVMPFGSTQELHKRLNQRRLDEQLPQLINTRVTKVGGTQPINVGPFNAELGGLYRHLYADIPKSVTREKKSGIRLKKYSKSLFELVSGKSLDASVLLRPGTQGMPDRAKRERHQQAAKVLVSRFMKPIDSWLRQWPMLDAAEKEQWAGHLPKAEQAWLNGDADREERDVIRQQAQRALDTAKFRDGESNTPPLLDDSDNRALKKALEQWLEAR